MAKIIYETNNYTIKKIPLNYRIDIKRTMVAINRNAGIERDCYSDIEKPLEKAIEVAERFSDDYFRSITEEESENNKIRAGRLLKGHFVWSNRPIEST